MYIYNVYDQHKIKYRKEKEKEANENKTYQKYE